jgi:WS/DGAT/MGAT family acyltransferase
VDDPHFDLDYHLRHATLPVPGDDTQLSDLMAEVMSKRLDRDHPLWEYWLVDGLADDHWALISKVHHALFDGVSGAGLHEVIFDPAPDAARVLPAATDPGQPPTTLALAGHAMLDMAWLPTRMATALAAAASQPAETIRQAREVAAALGKMATAAPAAPSSLSGPIGTERRYAWTLGSLTDIKKIKNALGGTVNDVVLAAISGAFRSLLLGRGEEPRPHMVPSLVPVSLRATGQEVSYHNRLSVLVADLPVHVADPAERLAAVRAEMSSLKNANEAIAGEALVALGRYTPYPLASRAVRLAYRVPQRQIVTVTTNVPGPRESLYCLGRRLVEIIPYVPIATTLRTGVSILSYCDRVAFGITGDYESVPDIDVLARGIEAGMAELLKAAGQAGQAA